MPRNLRPYRAHGRLDDESLRALKAQKILAMLSDVGVIPGERVCLDVGCAFGLITKHLATRFRFTVGLEYGAEALQLATRDTSKRLAFVQGDGQCLPLADNSLDVVVCAQVYEHVADPAALLNEVWRVLRPAGVCFFSGPNRLFPYEFHSHLPLVHWLPFSWTRRIVHWLGCGDDYDVHMATIWTLRRLVGQFDVQDMTVSILRAPEHYACQDEMGSLRWVGRLPVRLLRGILFAMPNFNWVLTKTAPQGEPAG